MYAIFCMKKKEIDSHGKDIENLRLSNLDRAMCCIGIG